MSGVSIPNFNLGNTLSAGGSLVSGVGGLVGGLVASSGYAQEANYYKQASTIAGENVNIENNTTELQQYLSDRALAQTQASVQAGTAGGGFQLGGSESWILRSNAQQGAISSALIGEQGAINANSYAQQQLALEGEASAANSASSAAGFGGILSGLGGIFKAASTFL